MNETTFLAAADYLNATLLPFGFDLIVLDGGWAGGYDSYGRPVPDAAKFPSTAGGAGLRALSDMAHARGLRFGVCVCKQPLHDRARAQTSAMSCP
jgi:hypothetical protein